MAVSQLPQQDIARAAGHVRLQALVVALWLAAFFAARVLEHAPHASLWFPPSAVTFAALLVAGRRALPAVMFACALATAITEVAYQGGARIGVIVSSSVLFGLVHGAAYALPATMLRRLARDEPADVTLRAVAAFLLYGALGAALAALGGVLGLRLTGLLETTAPAALIAAWWLGDYVALVTLAPVFAALIVRAAGHGARLRFAPFAASGAPGSAQARPKLALLFATTLAVLGAHHVWGDDRVLLAVLVLPVVLQTWIAHTESERTAQAGVVGFSLLTVAAGALVDVGDSAAILQFAAVSLAANSYLGLAVPALYAANVRLREQVTHDRLTGALSRAYFEDRVAHELARAHEAGAPAAVVMIDLDGLKALNDTHGHAAGDAALRELVVRCAGALRAGDLLGRLSGDEFAVFLPGTDGLRAARRVATMRARLRAAPLPATGTPLAASFGVAIVPANGSASLSGLLRAADEAMYRDKRAGRAR